MLKKLFKDKTLLVVLGLVIISLILHLTHISWPDWQIFDEIYYFNWAKDYIDSKYFFDVHPPLGKLFISLGLKIFNNTLFGARFFQAIVGSILIYFVYYLAKILFKNKTVGLFTAILFFLETSIYVESRFALINIFILFFTVLSFICFWLYREKGKLNNFYYSLFFASLAVSVKWTGASIFLIYFLFIIIDKKMRQLFLSNFKKDTLHIFTFILISVTSVLLPYLLIFTIDIAKGENLLNWHKEAYNFHRNLKSSHPYASRWYQWFLDLRPIWLEYKQTPQEYIFGINQIGNPIILWLGCLSIIFNIIWYFIKKNKALLFILVAIVVNTIPWMIISRESFYYHFIPIIPFVIVSLGYSLYLAYKKLKLKFIVIIIFLLALSFFVWYWPLLNGIKIPYKAYNSRIIIDSWR